MEEPRTALRSTGFIRRMKGVATIFCAGIAVIATATAIVHPVYADDLDDQRSALEGQVVQAESNVAGAQSALDKAATTLSNSRSSLAEARAALAKAQSDKAKAAKVDQEKADILAKANSDLADGKHKVAQARQAVEDQREKAAADMRASHQQNTGMLSIGMLFTEHQDFADVSSRIQWAQTVYNVNSTEMNRLTKLQLALQDEQAKLAELEDKARVAREDAAAQLEARQAAENAANDAENKVNALVKENEAAEAAARTTLQQQKDALDQKKSALDDVTAKINERNAQRQREEEQRRQNEAAGQNSGGEPAAEVRNQSGNGFPLGTPAVGPVTSPFAWRTNPVLGYSELHDGMDIGAGCGTPIYAAASGTVIETGYAGGWGWRTVIDHGYINGVQVSTGYNHAQGYIVSQGQHVERGQVIGYIGTTGLSTGCHLHFHVWINGEVTDPAGYL